MEKNKELKTTFKKDLQYYKFCTYGFLKNLRFFDPFFLLFLKSKGLSFTQIGILYSIKEILVNVLEIPTGVVADAMGRRQTMIFSFISYIFAFLVFYIAGSFYFFIGAMIFFSMGEAFRTGTHKAMIFEYLKIKGWENQKVHYYGHTRAMSQVGSAISSLLSAAIVIFSGKIELVFLCSIIPYTLDLFLMISYPKQLDGDIVPLKFREILKQFGKTIKDFVFSFKQKGIISIILNNSVFSGYYKGVKDYLQPVLEALALSIPVVVYRNNEKQTALVIGLVYFILYMLTSLSARKSGQFSEKFTNLSRALNTTLYLGFFAGILAGFFYRMEWFILSVVFYIVIYLFENLRKPIGISCLADRLEKNILATSLSAESQAETLFAALFAFLLGIFADLFGVKSGLLILSVMIFVLAPLITGLKRTRPEKEGV